MGNLTSNNNKDYNNPRLNSNALGLLEKQGEVRQLDVQVAHYTPSSFPLIPVVTTHTMQLCRDSWARILAPIDRDGVSVSGMTVFYTEFYDTLAVFDKMGKFESVLRRHSAGMNGIAAKGAILIRIVNYALALDPDSDQCYHQLYILGKSHNQKRIRPWQYAVFIQTLMNTISSRLGVDATHEVMNAWANLFAFVLSQMLPVAIKGLVSPNEIDINIVDESKKDKVAVLDAPSGGIFGWLR